MKICIPANYNKYINVLKVAVYTDECTYVFIMLLNWFLKSIASFIERSKEEKVISIISNRNEFFEK